MPRITAPISPSGSPRRSAVEEPLVLAVRQSLPGPGHQAAGRVERVVAVPAVSERRLLDAAAGVVDRLVGELDRMEVVDGDDRSWQAAEEPVRVAAVRVDRDDADLVAPCRARPEAPVGDVVGVAAGNDVKETTATEVDEGCRVERVAGSRGTEHLVLVHPERRDTREALGVLDERGAVTAHRIHRAPPGDAEVPGDLRDGMAVVPHTAADLDRGSTSQSSLDEGAPLGEGPLFAVRLFADEATLAPDEPERTSGDRQVPDLDHRAPMAGGDHTTGGTPGPSARRLDEDEALTLVFARRQHEEPLHAEQKVRVITTFHLVRGLRSSCLGRPQDSGATGAKWWIYGELTGSSSPTAERVEPINQ